MDECEICGVRGSFRRVELREMLFGTRETFIYHRCPRCGVLRIETIPVDLARHYPDDYYEPAQVAHADQRGFMSRQATRARNEVALFGTGRRRARALRIWARSATVTRRDREDARLLGLRSFGDPILDVGCGRYPGRLAAFQRIGYRNLLGIDPFLDADGSVDGIAVRRLGIGEVEGAYQAITFHHSFEHVSDPGATMAAAAARLRPGGVILIRTPVFGTWFWDRFGSSWWELDPPRHLFVHTPRSLAELAKRSGLEIAAIEWESSALELIASTQIARDIAWREPASWHVHPPGIFTTEDIDAFKRQAAALNAAKIAGRAAFYLRRIGEAVPSVRPTAREPSRIDRPAGAGPRDARLTQQPAAGPAAAVPSRADPRVRELVRAVPVLSRCTRPRLNLVIPTIDAASAFGGVRTALDAFAAIAHDDVPTRILSLVPIPAATAVAMSDSIILPPGEDSDHPRQLISLDDGGDGDAVRVTVGPNDVFVATFWPTADLVRRIRAWQQATYGTAPDRFAYLIQDDEPRFYPSSAQSVLAASTYDDREHTVALFNTSLLRDHFIGQGIEFRDAFVFEPRLSGALRQALRRAPRRRDRRIVVYGRPRTPRNAFPLLVEGLRAWRERYSDAAEWSVVSAGQDHPDVDLNGGRWLRSIGKLDVEAYGDLLRTSAAGLSLMISPHPSYPPLEMAHLGMLVLTNAFGVKDLSTWHDNILSLDEITAETIADGLIELCARFESDQTVGDRGATHRPDYLGNEPQFPFAAEVSALLGFPRG